jgi:hypothetical protein
MRVAALVLIGLVGLAPAAGAQTAATDPATVFAGLTGSCWRSQMDAALTDTHCFAVMAGAKVVIDTHKVRNAAGEVVYEGVTIYRRNPVRGQLVYDYFNAQGAQLQGVAVRTGDEILFSSVLNAPLPDIVWRLSADAYEVTPRTPELGHPGRFVRVPAGG